MGELDITQMSLRRIRPPNKAVLDAALKVLERPGLEGWCCQRSWFSTNVGTMLQGILFLVVVKTGLRPSYKAILASSERHAAAWAPSVNHREFVALCDALGLTQSEDIVLLYEFVNMRHGVVEQQEPPRRIHDSDEAAAWGIDPAILVEHPGKEIWWQRWGGTLYAVNVDIDPLEVSIERLAGSCGRQQLLPYWCIR